MKHALLVLLSLCLLGAAQAKTQYVTDALQIIMRGSQGANAKSLRPLSSGTQVEVLGETTSGYSRVRVQGEVGWVLTRQLTNESGAREQLVGLKGRLQVLQGAFEDARDRLAALQKEYKAMQDACVSANETKQHLEVELASTRMASTDAVRINNERIELRKAVADLTREQEDFKQKIRDLANQTSQRWFLTGAGAVVAGILLGLVLPRLRLHRRKQPWAIL